MNNHAALLLCKGLAKDRKLRTSGPRNTLCCVLGRRNSAWLDGTAPGLCIGFSGGNTDVKCNDRLIITEKTHEASCPHRCVPCDPLKQLRHARKIARLAQMTQSQTNGYFGGYIGKRQNAGKLETRKCVDKMYALRARKADQSEKKQQRAVTGRMITDIEMNSTLRGAVEESNLCRHLRRGDALFAECFRTYQTVDVNAQQWLHRLAVELERLEELRVPVFVPPTRKPNIRSSRCKAPLVDLYGFRDLQSPFALLSPYEFIAYWTAEALTPSETDKRTTWTIEGELLRKTPSFRAGKSKARPGIHYVVREPSAEDKYFVFPAEPEAIFGFLRHSWVQSVQPHSYFFE
jgi:hypothetical protein